MRRIGFCLANGGVSPMALTLKFAACQCRLSLRERTPFRGAKGDNVSDVELTLPVRRNVSETSAVFH